MSNRLIDDSSRSEENPMPNVGVLVDFKHKISALPEDDDIERVYTCVMKPIKDVNQCSACAISALPL